MDAQNVIHEEETVSNFEPINLQGLINIEILTPSCSPTLPMEGRIRMLEDQVSALERSDVSKTMGYFVNAISVVMQQLAVCLDRINSLGQSSAASESISSLLTSFDSLLALLERLAEQVKLRYPDKDGKYRSGYAMFAIEQFEILKTTVSNGLES